MDSSVSSLMAQGVLHKRSVITCFLCQHEASVTADGWYPTLFFETPHSFIFFNI